LYFALKFDGNASFSANFDPGPIYAGVEVLTAMAMKSMTSEM
jgi:hypothetical protein